MINKDSKIFLAGDRSQTAKDLKNILIQNGYNNIIGCNTSNLNLINFPEVDNFFSEHKPDITFIFAAKTDKKFSELQENPFGFLNDNLYIVLNTVNSCIKYQTRKIIYFASDVALPEPKNEYAMSESQIMQGPFIARREPYSLAKLVSLKLCTYANISFDTSKFITLLPCYIYGNSTKGLMFSILQDFMKAKEKNLPSITVWGNKNLKYKFMHSRDVADAAFFVMNNDDLKYDCYNVVPEKQISKYELVYLIAEQIDYKGEIIFDAERKLENGMNASSERLNSEGWYPSVSLKDGIKEMIEWYNSNFYNGEN